MSVLVCGKCFPAEDDWKLQPLRYNNPGLETDLGVGLWAYPLPVDYDQDGDLDLLVGCPDKPSNGVYFFENPTQDASISMPVFKPGVRVARGAHYMMLSRVNGEERLLTPGVEISRNESGAFDFEHPGKIPAATNPHAGTGKRIRANMWRYVDYDGDGDHDLAIGIGDWSDLAWDHAYDRHGHWRNGPLHGYIYLSENEGTDESPKYSKSPFRLEAGGGTLDVYGWPSPNFADFDGDGDLDLLCGEFLDGFTYFQNLGSRNSPEYASGVRLKTPDNRPLQMHLQMITPTAIDWDADGDTDLIVGDEDGRVAFVENTGDLHGGAPVFRAPQYFRQIADTLKFGALATPFVYDWDNDGDEDIICGNTAGSIGVFRQIGQSKDGTPRWSAPELLNVENADGQQTPFRIMAGPNGSIQGPCEAKWGYTTLSVCDWDGDGDGDIVCNSILGRLQLLLNNNGVLTPHTWDSGVQELPPKWAWNQTPATDTLTQWRTTPLCTDFDGDEILDLVMLDQAGYLTLRRSCGAAERTFVDSTGQPLRLSPGTCGRSGRVKLSIVDWDRDGRLDVLVNSANATWFRNVKDGNDGQTVLKRMGDLARRNVAGHTSSPAVCDFDSDGKPDLLVGSENGRIYHIRHDDCVAFEKETSSAASPIADSAPLITRQGFVFEKAPFAECHASTICETSRGLVAAWFGGSKEGRDDVGIWTSYHDGLRWSSPRLTANGIQHQDLRFPCWNPVLFQAPGDGPTLLFFKVGPNPRQWWGEIMVSYDRGRTFVERRRLPQGIDGPVRCKPMLLADGHTLLCGSSTEFDGWRVHFEQVSLVDGQPSGVWHRTAPINDASTYNAIQPTLLTQADGSILALCRTRESVVVSTVSKDQGRSWSELAPTDLPNPNSGIEGVTLNDGRHLLVYNPLPSGNNGWGRRSILSLAVSDDGVKWEKLIDLEKEESGEFSYPAVIQAEDGAVHVTYTWQRKRVKHLVISPTKI